MDILNQVFNSSLVVPLEVILYTALVSSLSLMRLNESCLINSLSFSLYWGFKNLVQTLSPSDPLGSVYLNAYVMLSFGTIILVNLAYYFDKNKTHLMNSPGQATGSFAPDHQ